MSIVKGVAGALVFMHSYRRAEFTQAALNLAGYVPVVGLGAAIGRIAVAAKEAFGDIKEGKTDEAVQTGIVFGITWGPRAFVEAVGFGWCFIPVDIIVTAVDVLYHRMYPAEA